MSTGTGAPAARRASSRPRRPGARPTAARVPELAHLSLAELRVYRQEVTAEEGRVSYWRRILQARLDLLVTDNDLDVVSRLRQVLTDGGGPVRRSALLAVLPADVVPPLPDLSSLWEAQPPAKDAAARQDLVDRLRAAERELSAYRQALHEGLDKATSELIARYAEDPRQALIALPLPPDPAG